MGLKSCAIIWLTWDSFQPYMLAVRYNLLQLATAGTVSDKDTVHYSMEKGPEGTAP